MLLCKLFFFSIYIYKNIYQKYSLSPDSSFWHPSARLGSTGARAGDLSPGFGSEFVLIRTVLCIREGLSLCAEAPNTVGETTLSVLGLESCSVTRYG